jgi:hypothetical protein
VDPPPERELHDNVGSGDLDTQTDSTPLLGLPNSTDTKSPTKIPTKRKEGAKNEEGTTAQVESDTPEDKPPVKKMRTEADSALESLPKKYYGSLSLSLSLSCRFDFLIRP